MVAPTSAIPGLLGILIRDFGGSVWEVSEESLKTSWVTSKILSETSKILKKV